MSGGFAAADPLLVAGPLRLRLCLRLHFCRRLDATEYQFDLSVSKGPHSYVALARPDQRPRACVVRGRLVQRHRLRSGSVGLTTGFGLK